MGSREQGTDQESGIRDQGSGVLSEGNSCCEDAKITNNTPRSLNNPSPQSLVPSPHLCGIDEAGRGPLAGPVCAAAVVLPADFPALLLDDSKKLTEKQREEVRQVIVDKAIAWGVGWAAHTEIDSINILRASLLAMQRAFDRLTADDPAGGWPDKLETENAFGKAFVPAELPPGLQAIVDGLHTPQLPVPCTALVKADASVREVMAASILAKTARDRLMEHYGRLYPCYGYDRHKGYPTKSHREMIKQHGPSPIQRMTFRAG